MAGFLRLMHQKARKSILGANERVVQQRARESVLIVHESQIVLRGRRPIFSRASDSCPPSHAVNAR